MNAKLTLVGAGPGDPDLISVKGLKALKTADVVLYDALVSEELLLSVKSGAIKVYVGKRAHLPSITQEKINELIVDYALKYGHVVRLKGGDPFVFARGHEELEFARAFGVETEAISGISSVNLPGLYDIPLTRRGVNESYWVVTATTKSGGVSNDIDLVAQSSATGVFLMGLRKLNVIVEAYKANGRQDLPVAIISKGSLPEAKVVKATIGTIEEEVRRNEVGTPAIIVAGEVVGAKLETLDLPCLNRKVPVYESA